MKKTLRNALWALLVVAVPAMTFAGGGMMSPNAVASDAPAVDPIMAPYYSKKIYKFDAVALAKVLSGRQNVLQEITCPSDVLLQHAGLANTSNKWTNVSYDDKDSNLTISYDFVNCNINGYRMNYDYSEKLNPISDSFALDTARSFMQKSRFKDVLKNTTAEPIIIGRYNGGMMMPLADGQEDGKMVVKPVQASATFTNITVLFPYVLNGKKVYSNYGGRVGITLEVTEKWVMNFNGQYINFPGVNNTSMTPITKLELAKAIKKGGNNRYYGKNYSVKLGQPEDIYAVVNDWKNGKNTVYVASAILMPSSTPVDEFYSPWSMYEMVITDYKFANPNMNQQPPIMY